MIEQNTNMFAYMSFLRGLLYVALLQSHFFHQTTCVKQMIVT